MRYLKTYENHKPSKDNLVVQINQIIDDAMLPILDEGFIQEPLNRANVYIDFYRVYKRVNLNGEGKADIFGYIDEDGNIKYNGRCQDDLRPILEEIENSMRIISGLSGLDFNFTFMNRYGQDNLIIEIRL